MAPKLNNQKIHATEVSTFVNECKEHGFGREKIQIAAALVLDEMAKRRLSFEDNVRPYLTLTDGKLASGFCHDALIFEFCKKHDMVLPVRTFLQMFLH